MTLMVRFYYAHSRVLECVLNYALWLKFEDEGSLIVGGNCDCIIMCALYVIDLNNNIDYSSPINASNVNVDVLEQ